MKTVLAYRNAIIGTKVTFQEKAFTLQKEKRVSDIERKVDSLTDIFRRSSPYRDNRIRPRYSPPPYRDSWNSGQFSPRQTSPSYDRGWPPRDSGGGNFGDAEYRGRSPIRRPAVDHNTVHTTVIGHLALKEGNQLNPTDLPLMEVSMPLNKGPTPKIGSLSLTDLHKIMEISMHLSKASIQIGLIKPTLM